MKREPTLADFEGSRSYYNVASPDLEVTVGGVVLIRYTLSIPARVSAGGTTDVTFWTGGGDCNDWGVINCYLTAWDMAWTTTGQGLNLTLGDAGGSSNDDLIDTFTVTATTGNPVTQPTTPNINYPNGYFGEARRHFYGDSYHAAYPVTWGGQGTYSIFSGLTVGLDASLITGSITDGYVQATVLLMPFG